jgi:hypothetical protein
MAVVRVLSGLLLVRSAGCAPEDEAEPDPLAACAEVGGGAPESVEAVVERVNALPQPHDLGCFLASLPRPLHLVATSSPFSLQPANGESSPRIFIVGKRMIMSVVPSGPGAAYLELGERVDDERSIKGELVFPPAGLVAPDDPYTRIVEEERHCDFCHTDETPHPTRPHAFVSVAFRPNDETLVPLATLREVRATCDTPEGDGEHCALLRALFDHGEVWAGAFPASMGTFY